MKIRLQNLFIKPFFFLFFPFQTHKSSTVNMSSLLSISLMFFQRFCLLAFPSHFTITRGGRGTIVKQTFYAFQSSKLSSFHPHNLGFYDSQLSFSADNMLQFFTVEEEAQHQTWRLKRRRKKLFIKRHLTIVNNVKGECSDENKTFFFSPHKFH